MGCVLRALGLASSGSSLVANNSLCRIRRFGEMALEKGWIDALRLPVRIMLGIFVASVSALALDYLAMIELDKLSPSLRSVTILMAVFSGALTLTGLGGLVYDALLARLRHSLVEERRQKKVSEKADAKEKSEANVLSRIDYLSEHELKYLADCLRSNSQTFQAYVHSPPVSTLMAKGIVYTPGGTHHEDHYPFIIRDFAWRSLLERKDEIIRKHEENQRRAEQQKRDGQRRR